MSLVDDLRERLREAEAAGRTREALLEFIAQRLPESTVLEYKRTLDLTDPKGRRNLTRTVAGFANADGGVLLLGVGEKDRTGEPDPEAELMPLTVPEGVDPCQQITNILNDLVRPRPRYDLVPFPAGEGRGVVVFVWPGDDRPYTVQDGADFEVPVRRGSSVVGASREELDRIYEGRALTRAALEVEAEAECTRYMPAAFADAPLAFVYVVPDVRRPDLLSLERLNASGRLRRLGTDSFQNLPSIFPGDYMGWRAHEEAGMCDGGPNPDLPESHWSRAVAYRDGRLAVWHRLLSVASDQVSPAYLIHALHASLAPYVRLLRGLGLLAGTRVLLWLRNVSGRRVAPLSSAGEVRVFTNDPRPWWGSLPGGSGHQDVDRLCFWLWEQALRAAGDPRQLHDWEQDPLARAVYGYFDHCEKET
ncbi:MAG: ATP-binding protein [Chloroflexi bacterium]|nr:ATP-binding protein [Chloroflexota bacterium]